MQMHPIVASRTLTLRRREPPEAQFEVTLNVGVARQIPDGRFESDYWIEGLPASKARPARAADSLGAVAKAVRLLSAELAIYGYEYEPVRVSDVPDPELYGRAAALVGSVDLLEKIGQAQTLAEEGVPWARNLVAYQQAGFADSVPHWLQAAEDGDASACDALATHVFSAGSCKGYPPDPVKAAYYRELSYRYGWPYHPDGSPRPGWSPV